MAVVTKLHQIMKATEKVHKDLVMKVQGGQYAVTSEASVLNTVRPQFVESSLVFVPSEVQRIERSGNVTTVSVLYTIYDADDGDSITIASVGQGADTQDKGAGKAMTYAGKYALMKALMLIASEDTDDNTSEAMDEEQKERDRIYRTIINWAEELVKLELFKQSDVAAIKARADEALEQGDTQRLRRGMKKVGSYFDNNSKKRPEEAASV